MVDAVITEVIMQISNVPAYGLAASKLYGFGLAYLHVATLPQEYLAYLDVPLFGRRTITH
jgi:hypothetical protein